MSDEISSKQYVRTVYHDAVGFYESWATLTGNKSATPYDFIDAVSPVTGARLRTIGAHADSSRWNKTKYLIEFQFLWTDDVPASWLAEWKEALAPYLPQLHFYSPGELAFDKILDAIQKVGDKGMATFAPWLILGYIVFDAYGETKGAVKHKLGG